MGFTVDHAEMVQFPKGYWHDGQFFGRRLLLCAWDDMSALAEEVAADGNNQWPVAQYPWGTSNAIVRKIEYKPYPGSQQLSSSGYYTSYEHGLLQVDYSTVGPVYHGGNWISEWLEPTRGYIQTDWRHLAWAAANGVPLLPGEAPRVPIYGLKYRRKYHRVLAVPSTVMDYIGYANSNAVACPALGINIPPERIVYRGARSEASHRVGTTSSYDVEYEFEFMPANVNKFWRAGKDNGDGTFGGWDDIYWTNPNGGRLKPFPTTTFFA
jgi:hypothetical protein